MATPNIVPRADSEGGLGTASKYWAAAYIDTITTTGNIVLPDNAKLLLGAGSDLQIYHDSNNSIIADTGTGNLLIRSGIVAIENAAGTENMATFTQDGAVELYCDNSKKFETTSGGITVTGSINAQGIQASSAVTAATIQLQGDLNVLNKAQTAYLTLADRDTSGS